MVNIFCCVVQCLDVATLDTEEESTVPLQSPHPCWAHQGWIQGTPQMHWVISAFLGMIIIHASSDLHPPNPMHRMVTPTTHHQRTNTLPHDFPLSIWKLGRCHRVCPQKPRNTISLPLCKCNNFYNSTRVFLFGETICSYMCEHCPDVVRLIRTGR